MKFNDFRRSLTFSEKNLQNQRTSANIIFAKAVQDRSGPAQAAFGHNKYDFRRVFENMFEHLKIIV